MKRTACAALLGLLPVPAVAQEAAWEGSLAVATGSYVFTERTTGWTLTNGLSAAAGPVTFRVSWPFLLQNSTLVTASGAAWVPTGGPTYRGMVVDSGAVGGSRRGSGMMQALDVPTTAITGFTTALGDPTAQASVRIGSLARSLTLRGAAKAPVTDTASFGTGRWDFGAGASLTYVLGQAAFVGADLAWWHLGDLPDLDFQDPVMGSVSAGAPLAAGWAGMVSLSGASSALAGYDGPWSVGAGLSRPMGRTIVGLTAAVGLTQTAPELSVAMSWRVRF